MSCLPGQLPADDELPAPDAATTSTAWMPALLDRTGELVEAAALELGLCASDAAQARRTAMLTTGDKTVLLLPMVPTDNGGVSMLISVQTCVPVVGQGGSDDAIAVLQQAPGALYALAAALGATPEGWWVVHRMVRIEAEDSAALARELRETVGLVDHLLKDLAAPAN